MGLVWVFAQDAEGWFIGETLERYIPVDEGPEEVDKILQNREGSFCIGQVILESVNIGQYRWNCRGLCHESME